MTKINRHEYLINIIETKLNHELFVQHDLEDYVEDYKTDEYSALVLASSFAELVKDEKLNSMFGVSGLGEVDFIENCSCVCPAPCDCGKAQFKTYA